jgi:hypothetical protein
MSFEWIVSQRIWTELAAGRFDFIDKARQVAGNVSVTGKRSVIVILILP